jgi:hypothetical protein
VRKKTGESAQIVDSQVRQLPGGVPFEAFALPQNRGGSTLECSRNEVTPVLARAGIRQKYFPRDEVAAVDSKTCHARSLRGEPLLDVFDLVSHT